MESKTRSFRLSLGLCIDCGNNPISSSSKCRCDNCLTNNKLKQKSYYLEHKKEIQVTQKKCVENKHEYYLQKKRNLYVKHKEKYLHDRKIARYKRRSAEGSHTLEEWKAVLQEFGNKCLKCGTQNNLERDHVIPIVKKGTNYIQNIQPLCKTCNRSKWNKIIDFRPFGNIILDWT